MFTTNSPIASRKIHGEKVHGRFSTLPRQAMLILANAAAFWFQPFFVAEGPVLVYHIYPVKFGFRRTLDLLSASIDLRSRKESSIEFVGGMLCSVKPSRKDHQ
jgi:hypothetical protein